MNGAMSKINRKLDRNYAVRAILLWCHYYIIVPRVPGCPSHRRHPSCHEVPAEAGLAARRLPHCGAPTQRGVQGLLAGSGGLGK